MTQGSKNLIILKRLKKLESPFTDKYDELDQFENDRISDFASDEETRTSIDLPGADFSGIIPRNETPGNIFEGEDDVRPKH